jgi:NAD(P)-dependent dehydrogenase (short-subunit alcohol dehydrogenase family)
LIDTLESSAIMDLQGKVVIVTGAAVGIGEAVARLAVSHGGRVVLVDLDARALDVARELGTKATAVIGDITDQAVIATATEQAMDRFGSIHGLVNNAGVVINGTALTISRDDWDRSLAVNLVAPLLWIRAILPCMLPRRSGSIVNVTSVIGTLARPNGVAYICAKAGMIGLTRSIALDFGPLGIRCNAVCPGSIETPMLKSFNDANPGARTAQLAKSYVGRLGKPDDVAEACIHLLSDRAPFTNGAELVIDGGMTAALL